MAHMLKNKLQGMKIISVIKTIYQHKKVYFKLCHQWFMQILINVQCQKHTAGYFLYDHNGDVQDP